MTLKAENSDEREFTKIQRYQFIDRLLNENFPLAFVIILALVNILNGTGLIGLQIISIINQTPLYYVAIG